MFEDFLLTLMKDDLRRALFLDEYTTSRPPTPTAFLPGTHPMDNITKQLMKIKFIKLTGLKNVFPRPYSCDSTLNRFVFLKFIKMHSMTDRRTGGQAPPCVGHGGVCL